MNLLSRIKYKYMVLGNIIKDISAIFVKNLIENKGKILLQKTVDPKCVRTCPAKRNTIFAVKVRTKVTCDSTQCFLQVPHFKI